VTEIGYTKGMVAEKKRRNEQKTKKEKRRKGNEEEMEAREMPPRGLKIALSRLRIYCFDYLTMKASEIIDKIILEMFSISFILP
jgi:hypothetical protein